MVRQSGFPAAVSTLPAWSLLFAREPEPDLDLDEMDDQDKAAGTGTSPDDPEKPSGQRPLLLALLAVVAIGGGYLAMNPDLLMDMMGAGTEAVPTPAPPPARPAKQAAVPPGDSPASGAPAMPKPAPAPPAPVASQAATPAGPSAPATSGSPAVPPSAQTAKPSPAPTSPPLAASTPSPLFSEGQPVTLVPDPKLPAAAVALSGDAARTKPGPMVNPSAVLTVLDGELRGNVWIYAVRTPQGTTGWIAEKQLRAAKR